MRQSIVDPESELRDRLFGHRDLVLLSAMAGEDLDEKDLASLTDGIDVDTESLLYMLALGILGFRRGWDGLLPSAVPRFKGFHRYYQVRNSAGAPWFKTQMTKLIDADIPFVLTGGSAMRAVYASDAPRMQAGYDMTIRSCDYDRAAEVLREGLRADADVPRERTVNGYTRIFLHKGVPDSRFFLEKAFWERCGQGEFLGRPVLVPCPEDMLLHLFCVPNGPWLFREKQEDRDRRLYEALFVRMNREIDFSRLGALAETCGQKDQVRFWLQILSGCAPEQFPKEQWEPFFSLSGTYGEFVKNMVILGREVDQHDALKKRSLWRSFRLALAEYRTVQYLGKKSGLLAYILDTRRITGIGDLFSRKKNRREDESHDSR